MEVAPPAAPGPQGPLRRIVEAWALLGGFVMLGVVLMTSWSSASGYFFGRPLPGDVELTEMLTAVSVFMFLPYCQLTGANVTADIFTAGAGPRTVAALQLASALIALGFSVLLIWRMWYGLADYREFVETTTILHVPIWYAYLPALASLVLLAAASAASVRETLRELRS